MKVGGREVIHNLSLVVPKGEVAEFGFSVGSWEISVNFEFIDTDDKTKGAIELSGENNTASIKFLNWENSLGSALKNPVEFARTNTGHRITFMACHWRIGEVNKIDLQFLLEEISDG